MFGQKFWVRAKILGLGENFGFGQKFWVRAKREYYDGVPCANFAVSLFISFSAAPNFSEELESPPYFEEHDVK